MFKLKTFHKSVAPFLRPAGFVYGQIMRARSLAYGRKLFESFSPSIPTVAVGNISWGGTGKTPVVNWLLDWAGAKGLHAAVLTRGYKAQPPTLPFVVNVDASPIQAGDEPLMLAKCNPKAVVIVDPKRGRAATYAMQYFRPDFFVLDDGFQHLAMGRHKNIVLLTSNDIGPGWNKVIPAGTWREDSEALERADVFLLRKDCGNVDTAGALLANAAQKLPPRPIFLFSFVNYALRKMGVGDSCCREAEHVQKGETQNLAVNLEGRPYVLFCGVGTPESVYRAAEKLLGYAPLRFYPFADHHAFTSEDIVQMAKDAPGVDLVCTEKDAVKLENILNHITPKPRIWAMQMKVEFLPNEKGQSFSDWWETAFTSIVSKKE